MIFVTLSKFRKKPTKESTAQATKLFDQMAKDGIKIIGQYWTLGRYDAIVITEAKDEKTVLKHLIQFADVVSLETLVALTREEAIKLLG
jgi:uncharacterized protein with GYD domain